MSISEYGPTGWADCHDLIDPDRPDQPVTLWISDDNSQIWFSHLSSVGGVLSKEQTVQMLGILNKRFLLDAMSQA